MMRREEIRYAPAGEHEIAFREHVGDRGGDQEIVVANFAWFPMEALPEDPVANRLLEGLAGLGRVVLFDRRGIGLSDPVTDWETPLREQWADDLAAVIEAAGLRRPTVFSWVWAPVARTCAVRHPGLIGRLVLFNPGTPPTDPNTKAMATTAMQETVRGLRLGGVENAEWACPDRWKDPAFRRWAVAAGRAGAGTPGQMERLWMKNDSDPPLDHSRVGVPTMVIGRAPRRYFRERAVHRWVADQIPGARYVDLGDGDAIPWSRVDELLVAVSRFVTGEVHLPPPERHVAVVMFTDLVESTRRAASVGDEEWKLLLNRHDAIIRAEVAQRGGEVIKTTGDGVLALLTSATSAVEAARAIRSELDTDELQVRTGIHVGEIDRRGDDVSGVAVHLASRIMSTAEPGQIVVSDIVIRMTDGVGQRSLGPTTLKGFDGTWELFELT